MQPVTISRALGVSTGTRLCIARSVSNFRAPGPNDSRHQSPYRPREAQNDLASPGSSRYDRPRDPSSPTKRDQTFRPTERPSGRPSGLKTGPLRDVHVAQQVKYLCERDRLAEAIEYCTNAPSALQGPVAWNTIIMCALKKKRYTFAYQQFLAMKKRAVVPTVATYHLFLSAFAEAHPSALIALNRERAQKLYNDWTSLVSSGKAKASKGVFRSHPAAAYINVLANMGESQAIWDIYYQLEPKGPLAPNEHVFTSMFLAIAKRYVKGDEIKEIRARNASDGKLIWRQAVLAAEKQSFPFDSHLVTAALRVLRHGGPAEHELAFTIISDHLGLQGPGSVDIPRPDVKLDTRAVDAALSVCVAADRPDLVHHFIDTLINSKDHRRARAVTTSAMNYVLVSHAAAGNSRQAMQTIDWMLKESGLVGGLDVKPGNSSWSSAFRACVQTKDWATAKLLIRRLFGQDLRHWVTIPDAETVYLILNSAYVSESSDRQSHEEQIQEALHILELVVRRWAPARDRLADLQPTRAKRRLDFHNRLADLVKKVLLEFGDLQTSGKWNTLARRMDEMQVSLSNDSIAPDEGGQ